MGMTEMMIQDNDMVYLVRNHEWTGAVIRSDGDMTEVAWLTGTLAGETKWTGTENIRRI